MDAEFQTTGTCRFSPPLGRSGNTQRRDGRTTEWWMILECDREIGRYFRSLYWTAHYRLHQLSEPLWGTHVSVIRDEKPPRLEHWKMLEGKPLNIRYRPDVEIHSGYAFVQVQCDAVLDYRESLGLPREPDYPLHMTIGNLKS